MQELDDGEKSTLCFFMLHPPYPLKPHKLENLRLRVQASQFEYARFMCAKAGFVSCVRKLYGAFCYLCVNEQLRYAHDVHRSDRARHAGDCQLLKCQQPARHIPFFDCLHCILALLHIYF